MSAPQMMKGNARRSSRPATASSAKDAGTWPKLRAVSVALIRSGRPAAVRWPGRNALQEK